VAASGTEMLIMHLTEMPPPCVSWCRCARHVEAAIMRGLARARRPFDSMASFVGALRADADPDALTGRRPRRSCGVSGTPCAGSGANRPGPVSHDVLAGDR